MFKELIPKKSQYGETSFGMITRSGLVSKDDLKALSNLKGELIDTFKNVQVFRTRTEMEVSVLNDLKFPTPDAKFWQATREQNVMFQELVMLSYEYRKNLVKMQILERKIENEKDPLEKELLRIELERKNFIALNQERTAKARIEEIKDWHEIKEREKKQLSADTTDCDNHQLISYTKRWINQRIAMGDQGSPAERNNLLGQLRSGIKKCIERKVIDRVLRDFPLEIEKKIREEYNIPLK